MQKLLLFTLCITLLSCKQEPKKTIPHKKPDDKEAYFLKQLKLVQENVPEGEVLVNDTAFINNSLLKGKFRLDISRYEADNIKNRCYPNREKQKTIGEDFEGLENLGDINGDGKKESAFVLESLNTCEDGDSYYFTDNNIPRIQTDSYCCHPYSLFSIGDIDEDGGIEIAEYYSACTSNYKGINILTLKKGEWKSVAHFVFLYSNGKYEVFKDFHKLHRKLAKNKFQFLEISDMRADGTLVQEWKTVTME